MSIRLIGSQAQSTRPVITNYARGHSMSPQQKTHFNRKHIEMESYKEELDRQVAELRKRKLEKKQREQEEDEKREREFYESLKNIDVSPPMKYNTKKHRNQQSQRYFINPESTSNFKNAQLGSQGILHHDRDEPTTRESKFASIGRRKMVTEPSFDEEQYPKNYHRTDRKNLYDRSDENDFSPQKLEKRRRDFREEIDRQLRDAFYEISKSKMIDTDEQYKRISRKLIKTEGIEEIYQPEPRLPHSRVSTYENERSYEDLYYQLPARRHANNQHSRHISNL